MSRQHDSERVPYVPSTLKAVGKKAGKEVVTDEVRTVGKAKRLVLRPDRATIHADGEDLSFVTVQVVDADGLVCPGASDMIQFHISGPACIAGVDDGNPICHEPFKADKHSVIHGLGLAVLKAGRGAGKITLRAEAEGLEPAETVLQSATTITMRWRSRANPIKPARRKPDEETKISRLSGYAALLADTRSLLLAHLSLFSIPLSAIFPPHA